MSAPFWVDFKDRQSACVEAPTEAEATEIAAGFGTVVKVQTLPYPRSPRLGPKTDCPSFCYGGSECLGRTCCPKKRACDD